MDWGSCVMKITAGGTDVNVPTIKCFEVIYKNILTIVLSLAVLALFIMLLIGGFKYLTSGGDQKATASAQQTITYAIIGIALLSVAFLIFQLIRVYTGVDPTKFSIPEIAPTP